MACAKNSIVDYYYITLPLQGQHKHLVSQSIHMNRIRIPSGHLARHRSARWTKNYSNDDDADEDRYIYLYINKYIFISIYFLVVITPIYSDLASLQLVE